MSLGAATAMGTVRLTVSDLGRARDYYERVIGLHVTEVDNGDAIALNAGGGPALLELHGDMAAPRLDPSRTGLFHFALLLPNRRELALALVRIAREGGSLTGASDHLVSEALYMSDPDGNGIEIYRDRPRSEWEREGESGVRMATLPLDLDDLVGELGGDVSGTPSMPAGTVIGHVHLQVRDLESSDAFYAGLIGFDVMQRSYPGALFVSAGGYHHHLGLNIWNSRGAPAPEPGSIGLRSFDVVLGDGEELEYVLTRLRAAGVEVGSVDGSSTPTAATRDPSGNRVLLRAR
jgi:catechol 2,3-dioxygenase